MDDFVKFLGEAINNPMFMLGVCGTMLILAILIVADSVSRDVVDRLSKKGAKVKTGPTLVLMDLDGTLFHWNENADYTAPGYFESLEFFEPMRQLVDILRNDDNYVFMFCTCYLNKQAMDEKARALKKLFPNLHASEVIFVPYGDNKSDYIPYDEYDDVVLIDDHTPNLIEAQEHGAKAIKAMNGVNGKNGRWNGQKMSVLAPASVNMTKGK